MSQLSIPDEEIVLLLLSKDKRGLEYLYDKYSSSIYGTIKRDVADFAVDEHLCRCFKYYWDHIESFDRSKQSLFTWMTAIALKLARE